MEVTIPLTDFEQARTLFGPQDQNLKALREGLQVSVVTRQDGLVVSGSRLDVKRAQKVISQMMEEIERTGQITPDYVTAVVDRLLDRKKPYEGHAIDVLVPDTVVIPRTPGQAHYVEVVSENELVFCIGPAGTGKTYLAVALAVQALKHRRVRKIILARPAVEAGERLGFLPGDIQAKVNPYLRPLYDALADMTEFNQLRRYMENDMIEVIPLAYMRGRTFNHAFIILDEAQNCTAGQMKMCLTRIGQNSRAIITGDITQIDLSPGEASGLVEVQKFLKGIKGIQFMYLKTSDIVRHRLVQNIVEAYGRYEEGRIRRSGAARRGGEAESGQEEA